MTLKRMAPKRNRKLLNSPKTRKSKKVLEESDDEIVHRDQKEQDESISTEEKSEEEKDEAGEEEDDNVSRESMKKRAKPVPSAPAVNSGSKRQAETECESKGSKKRKSANINGDEEKKGRLWSDHDEITILNGLIEFQSENGPVTKPKTGAFHDLIKHYLEADADDIKLYDKVKRLKAKYFKKCQDWVFPTPHEWNTFTLSERVWGVEPKGHADGSARKKTKTTALTVSDDSDSKLAEKIPDSNASSKKKYDSKVAEKNDNPDLADNEQDTEVGVVLKPEGEGDKFGNKYPCLSLFLRQAHAENLSGTMMLQKMPLLGSSKAKELDEIEEILSEMQLTEMKLDIKKRDVRIGLVKLVLDASSKN